MELKERSASQSHFNDLCQLLGVVAPITADPNGEFFTFEKRRIQIIGRRRLGRAFTDPERLNPEKTRQLLTEEAAEQFAKIAQRLRDRKHDAEEVAHVSQMGCLHQVQAGASKPRFLLKYLS